MKCCCCDRLLSDYESTRKSKSTGEYLDMCNKCYKTVQDSVPAIESTELPYEEAEETVVDCSGLYDEYDDWGNLHDE